MLLRVKNRKRIETKMKAKRDVCVEPCMWRQARAERQPKQEGVKSEE